MPSSEPLPESLTTAEPQSGSAISEPEQHAAGAFSEPEAEGSLTPEPISEGATLEPIPESENQAGIGDEAIFFIALYSFFIALILTENILLIVGFRKSRKFMNNINRYVMSLACADVCVACLVIPSGILGYFSEEYLMSSLCRACVYFERVAGSARLICMLTIAVNRFKKFMRPDTPEESSQRCNVNILIGWTFALVYAIPAPIFHDMILVNAKDGSNISFMTCGIHDMFKMINNAFMLVDFICLYVMPLFMIVALYTILIIKLQKNDAVSKTTIFMLILLISMFGVFKLPLHVYKLYINWGPGFFKDAVTVHRICSISGFLGSSLNFIVVMVFNDTMRNAVKKIVCTKQPSQVQPENGEIQDLQLHSEDKKEQSRNERLLNALVM